MFLGKEFCLQISKRGLGPCPKHMSFLAAFPKMLFELEHHQEEERRFVRLLMQFFLPRQTWRNMQSVADNSGERGMRAASFAPSM